MLLSTAGFLAPLGSDRVSWDAGREAGSALERQISMKKKKKKKCCIVKALKILGKWRTRVRGTHGKELP